MRETQGIIISNKKICQNIYTMTLSLENFNEEIKAGQFLNISTGDKSRLLKRPFGIVKSNGNIVEFSYQIKGEGTINLSNLKEGEKLNVLLPLGNGFELDKKYKKIALIGGGVGIFPLISVIDKYKDREFYSYIGYRNKELICGLEDLSKSKKLVISTDDGSYGLKGNSVQTFFNENIFDYDLIISCGPPIMLKNLKIKLQENKVNIPCLVSLEERMGCGIGACLVCVCKLENGKNARVCKDGPVFDINEVDLNG